MEIILLIIIIVVFLVFLNRMTTKLDRLQDSFYDLSRKLDQYKKIAESQERPAAVEKPAVSFTKPEYTPPKPAPVAEKSAAVPVPEPGVVKPVERAAPVAAFAPPASPPKQPVAPPVQQKSWWQNFKEQNPDLEKFIGENLINKIGILILVLGISYFVKYAIDKDWIGEPARVGIGILAGGIVMLVAHKLRVNFKSFSSVLVAGAISIFYFTIVVAFHDYHLFSQTVAFIIMVVITAFSAFISVSYDRKELAALTLIGGFAAPFMVSTGSGNYVVLFTYIAILNIGILSIAYYKKWGIINLQAYVFTAVLYGGWLSTIEGTENAPYKGALAFGFLFYFMFILMNIINNIRTKTSFTNMQLSILVSNTFLFYAAGMLCIESSMPEYKGLFTLLLGAFNFCFAWLLYKKLNADQKVIYILIGLTLTFITLAIPIQFEGNYITLFWAAEAVLLIWLAQKSKIGNFRFGSVIVHGLMLISLVMDWVDIYFDSHLTIIANPGFLASAFAIASCFAVLALLKNDKDTYRSFGLAFNGETYSRYLGIITIMLVYVAGFLELSYQAYDHLESSHAAYTLDAIYHMLFGALFIQLHGSNSGERGKRFATLLGAFNILLYILLLTLITRSGLEEYLSGLTHYNVAYWLHFILLGSAVYTTILVYNLNREVILTRFTGKSIMPWIVAFFFVYAASNELVLHWLAISMNPVQQYQQNQGITVALYDIIANMEYQAIKTGFPVLWGVLACGMLMLGIKKQLKTLRIAALVLLGVTIAKLFLYDISNASETGKIIAFILLGVLILVISFVYQKIKMLVIADKPEDTNETTDENN